MRALLIDTDAEKAIADLLEYANTHRLDIETTKRLSENANGMSIGDQAGRNIILPVNNSGTG